MELVRSFISIASGLPCVTVRSAPAIVFSRPAQRSLTLWPARSPSRYTTLYIESSDRFVASAAASIATGWSEPVPGRELHPLKSSAFHGALLRQTIAADPSNIDARVLLGKTLALQGVRGEAIEQLAEAVRLNPSSATAHNEFGMVLSRFVEVKAARQEFRELLNSTQAWRRLMSTCHCFSHRLASWPRPVIISIAPLNYKVTTQRPPTRIT